MSFQESQSSLLNYISGNFYLYKGNHIILFCRRSLSLSIMFLKFAHIVAHINSLLSFITEQYPLCEQTPLYISIFLLMNYFWFLDTMSRTAKRFLFKYFPDTVSFLLKAQELNCCLNHVQFYKKFPDILNDCCIVSA